MKKIINWLVLVLTGKNEDAVKAGICNYAGQGRDGYGL